VIITFARASVNINKIYIKKENDIIMNFNKENLIKSPLNYTGGKLKLLPQILPLLPNNIDTFVDLFCGGSEVGINVNAKRIVANDILKPIVDLFNYFMNNNSEDIIKDIQTNINKYNLSQTSINGYEFYNCNSNDGVGSYNKDKYILLRDDYNNGNKNPIMFYTMVLYSFNNMIRFNDKGEFNVAVNKRDFNNNIKKNLIKYIEHLHKLNIEFWNSDFRNMGMSINTLSKDDLVYCDPPYLITTANYNERGGWAEKDEKDLLNLLDSLNDKDIKFALSNVLEHKGKENYILKEWSKKYNVNYLDCNYGNCNYHTKDKSKNSTVEVLITNYIKN
jgi:DNA adenine methylase